MPTLSKNFDFLLPHAPDLARLGAQAEGYFAEDPNVTFYKLRQFGELFARRLAARTGLPSPAEEKQHDRINRLRTSGAIPAEIGEHLHRLRTSGNDAVHEFVEDRRAALTALKTARLVGIWYCRVITGEVRFSPCPFVPPRPPADGSAELLAEIERLRAQLNDSMDAAARHAEELRAEAERRMTAEERALRAERERAEWQALAESVDEDARRFEEQLSELRAAGRAAPALAAFFQLGTDALPDLGLDESETRRIIDAKLRAAGWEVDSQRLTHGAGIRPERGRNRAIAEWPTSDGRADYVLFVGLTPVATIEAKRARTNVSDLRQTERYAAALDAPFAFASNGRPFHRQFRTGSGIWFRDTRSTTNAPRALSGWPTPEGLAAAAARNLTEADAHLAAQAVDFAFGPRPYQVRAIRAVERAIAAGQRDMLVAMATGTGKTKTAIGLMHRLLESRRVRRILFLVDRNPLAKQAVDTFEETKITATQSFADVYNLKKPKDTAAEVDTQVQVATVQAMVRRLFKPAEGETPPPADHYDCIIVDECHRGYLLDREMGEEELRYRDLKDYVSKYRQVLDHFDAIRIGLTATPAVHTADIFGPPIFEYRYEDGVLDDVLIDHDTPLRIETELSRAGIAWEAGEEADLFDPGTGAIETVTLDDELAFEVEDFNRKVLTDPFNDAVAAELVKHIPPDTPAKTLVFAVDDAHADTLVKALDTAYRAAYGPIDHDLVAKITRGADRADDLIKHYKTETFPKVAITVELLTTGIDVPAIANLVFVRRVNSRILYEQMIGRATRPCDAFDKPTFRIFDAVGLYTSMQRVTAMRPVVTDPNITFTRLAEELTALYGIAPRPSPSAPGFADGGGQAPFAGPAADEGRARYLLGQIVGKLQRRRRVLSGEALARFNILYPEGPAAFTHALRNAEPAEAAALLARHAALVELLDGRGGYGGSAPPKPIAPHPDAPLGVTPTYGAGFTRPEDYLGAFSAFVRDNMNAIPALTVAATRPRDLTRAQLKELRRLLEERHFRERDLETAWRQSSNAAIAATIIGYIRRVAIGDPLVPYEQRVDAALLRLLERHTWGDEQRLWLERIAEQLKREVVVDRAALDEEPFREPGGFRILNRVFGGRMEEVLAEFEDEVWRPAGQTGT